MRVLMQIRELTFLAVAVYAEIAKSALSLFRLPVSRSEAALPPLAAVREAEV